MAAQVLSLTPQISFDLSDPATLKFNLDNPRPKDIHTLIEVFEADMKANPDPGPLPVKTGWNDITPDIAVNLLRRNRPGANRQIDPGTVFYYANQMARGQWKPTGQPILFGENDTLKDAQHRLMACIVSGVTFRTYVITGIEEIPNLFAYIDNTRPRTSATALQTAGFNGVASLIAKVIRLGEEMRHGVYSKSGATKIQRLAPIDTLTLIDQYPNAHRAARSAASDWAPVVQYLQGGVRKEVVAYFGMRVLDLYGEDVVEEFFDEVLDDREDRASDDPVREFRRVMEKDAKGKPIMVKQQVLANLILTFNAWRSGQPLARKWKLQGTDEMPQFNEPEEAVQAAE